MRSILFVLLLSALSLHAQEEVMISIEAIIPEQMVGLDVSALKILKTKMDAITTNNGVSSSYNGTFVMLPHIDIVDASIIEGGLRNIHQVNLDISFSIYQQSTKALFSNFSLTTKGSGYTKSEAVKSAIRNIKSTSTSISTWFTECKQKINGYYTSHCKGMIAEARSLAARGEYSSALGLLATYPSGIKGYENIADAEIEIYLECSKKECSYLINHAKAAIIQQEYDIALQILSDLDAHGQCGEEIQQLTKRIDLELKAQRKAAEEKEERAHQEELYRENANRQITENQRNRDLLIRQARMGTIQSIACSFFQSLPSVLSVYF